MTLYLEYRGHIRGGHVRDELTPLMIFLTTDFDYRCAKLGTIFTEKRDLTEDEITKVSFSFQKSADKHLTFL